MPKLALPNLVRLAQELRKQQTDAEAYLWERLRKSKLAGFKFRRQHPMGGFILDFYCEEKRLAIEVDGGIHDQEEVKRRDIYRQKLVEETKIKVIRFTNDEVMRNIDGILAVIHRELAGKPSKKAAPHLASPQREERRS